MSDQINEVDLEDVPKKHYPDYHFRRVSGDKVMIVAYINDRRYGGTFDLEALDTQFTTEENPDLKFVFGKATQFLLEER